MRKLLLLMLFLQTVSIAGTWDRTKGVGLSVSAVKFMGDQVDRAALGSLSGLVLKYGLSPNVLFDFSLSYGSFKPVIQGSRFTKDAYAPYRTFLLPFSLTMKISTAKQGLFKPYIFVGGGGMFWDLRDVGTTGLTFWADHKFRWGEKVSGLRKNALLIQGLGFELFLNEHFAADIQGRYTTILKVKNDDVGYADFNDQILEGRINLTYYFGFYKDSDQDGIEDKRDRAPLLAEDFDGFQDGDGAPDTDNDNDGVIDERDGAPFDPEDIDGYQDEDGIPDPDNDGDGIYDHLDKCPMNPEDLDGFEDEDGCPDRDNDSDAIPDEIDGCPDERETYNGFQDEDGCPDEEPKSMGMLEKTGTNLILQGVTFSSGSAALKNDSYPILTDVINELLESPDVHVEIRGYTDSLGKESVNMALSQARAETIKRYLIEHGIEAFRLTSVGFGEENPVASNSTREGRAKNRRIEFIRVK